jgi:hypothetical protein
MPIRSSAASSLKEKTRGSNEKHLESFEQIVLGLSSILFMVY